MAGSKGPKKPQSTEKPAEGGKSYEVELQAKLKAIYKAHKAGQWNKVHKPLEELCQEQPCPPAVIFCKAKVALNEYANNRPDNHPERETRLLSILQIVEPYVNCDHPRSWLVFCFYVHLQLELARNKPGWEDTYKQFEESRKVCEVLFKKHNNWTDPLYELHDPKPVNKWEALEAPTAEERQKKGLAAYKQLMELAKREHRESKDRLFNREDRHMAADRSDLLFRVLPSALASDAERQNKAQQIAALTLAEERKLKAKANEGDNVERPKQRKQNRRHKDDQKRQQMELTVKKVKEYLSKKLPDATPEERREAFLKLTEMTVEEFEKQIKDTGMLKAAEMKDFFATFKYYREHQRWLHWYDPVTERRFDTLDQLMDYVETQYFTDPPRQLSHNRDLLVGLSEGLPTLQQVWRGELLELGPEPRAAIAGGEDSSPDSDRWPERRPSSDGSPGDTDRYALLSSSPDRLSRSDMELEAATVDDIELMLTNGSGSEGLELVQTPRGFSTTKPLARVMAEPLETFRDDALQHRNRLEDALLKETENRGMDILEHYRILSVRIEQDFASIDIPNSSSQDDNVLIAEEISRHDSNEIHLLQLMKRNTEARRVVDMLKGYTMLQLALGRPLPAFHTCGDISHDGVCDHLSDESNLRKFWDSPAQAQLKREVLGTWCTSELSSTPEPAAEPSPSVSPEPDAEATPPVDHVLPVVDPDDDVDLRPHYGNGTLNPPSPTLEEEVEVVVETKAEKAAAAERSLQDGWRRLVDENIKMVEALRDSGLLTPGLLTTIRTFLWLDQPLASRGAIRDVPLSQMEKLDAEKLQQLRQFLLCILGMKQNALKASHKDLERNYERILQEAHGIIEVVGSEANMVRLSGVAYSSACRTRAQRMAQQLQMQREQAAQAAALQQLEPSAPDEAESTAVSTLRGEASFDSFKSAHSGEEAVPLLAAAGGIGTDAGTDDQRRSARQSPGPETRPLPPPPPPVVPTAEPEPLTIPVVLPGTAAGEDALIDSLYGMDDVEGDNGPTEMPVTWDDITVNLLRCSILTGQRRQLEGQLDMAMVKLARAFTLLQHATPQEVRNSEWCNDAKKDLTDEVNHLRAELLRADVQVFKLQYVSAKEQADYHSERRMEYQKELNELEEREKQESKRGKSTLPPGVMEKRHQEKMELLQCLKAEDEDMKRAWTLARHFETKHGEANNLLQAQLNPRQDNHFSHILRQINGTGEIFWPQPMLRGERVPYYRDLKEATDDMQVVMRESLRKLFELDIIAEVYKMSGHNIFWHYLQGSLVDAGAIHIVCSTILRHKLESHAKEDQAKELLEEEERSASTAKSTTEPAKGATAASKKKKKRKSGAAKPGAKAGEDGGSDEEVGEAAGGGGLRDTTPPPDVSAAVASDPHLDQLKAQREQQAQMYELELERRRLELEKSKMVPAQPRHQEHTIIVSKAALAQQARMPSSDDEHSIENQRRLARQMGYDNDDWEGRSWTEPSFKPAPSKQQGGKQLPYATPLDINTLGGEAGQVARQGSGSGGKQQGRAQGGGDRPPKAIRGEPLDTVIEDSSSTASSRMMPGASTSGPDDGSRPHRKSRTGELEADRAPRANSERRGGGGEGPESGARGDEGGRGRGGQGGRGGGQTPESHHSRDGRGGEGRGAGQGPDSHHSRDGRGGEGRGGGLPPEFHRSGDGRGGEGRGPIQGPESHHSRDGRGGEGRGGGQTPEFHHSRDGRGGEGRGGGQGPESHRGGDGRGGEGRGGRGTPRDGRDGGRGRGGPEVEGSWRRQPTSNGPEAESGWRHDKEGGGVKRDRRRGERDGQHRLDHPGSEGSHTEGNGPLDRQHSSSSAGTPHEPAWHASGVAPGAWQPQGSPAVPIPIAAGQQPHGNRVEATSHSPSSRAMDSHMGIIGSPPPGSLTPLPPPDGGPLPEQMQHPGYTHTSPFPNIHGLPGSGSFSEQGFPPNPMHMPGPPLTFGQLPPPASGQPIHPQQGPLHSFPFPGMVPMHPTPHLRGPPGMAFPPEVYPVHPHSSPHPMGMPPHMMTHPSMMRHPMPGMPIPAPQPIPAAQPVQAEEEDDLASMVHTLITGSQTQPSRPVQQQQPIPTPTPTGPPEPHILSHPFTPYPMYDMPPQEQPQSWQPSMPSPQPPHPQPLPVEALPAVVSPAKSTSSWAQMLKNRPPSQAPPPHANGTALQPMAELVVEDAEGRQDADLRRAMEASLADSRQSTATGYDDDEASSHMMVEEADLEQARVSSSSGADLHSASAARGPGLRNASGEYNCFLNVIIQCLWHCRSFRAQALLVPPQAVAGQPVVAALLALFRSLNLAEEQWMAGQGGSVVVDPTQLREALDAHTAGKMYRVGEMNDAAELLCTLYECMKEVRALEGVDGSPSLVDDIFGLQLHEFVQCENGHCHKVTHQVPSHIEYFHVVSATALRTVVSCHPGHPFGVLLRILEEQHSKSCDKDVGGCGQLTPITKKLERTPQVFTVQLAWEEKVEPSDIRETLSAVGSEHVDLADVFGARDIPGNSEYRLISMACYYGQHYFAFVLGDDGSWLLFDDYTSSAVGRWADVVRKCVQGRIQPSVLFFSQSHT